MGKFLVRVLKDSWYCFDSCATLGHGGFATCVVGDDLPHTALSSSCFFALAEDRSIVLTDAVVICREKCNAV